MREQLLGADHPRCGRARSPRVLRYSAGDQEGAKALYERALAIQETLGPDAPGPRVTLNDYAGCCWDR
jgi:hypothetical protein